MKIAITLPFHNNNVNVKINSMKNLFNYNVPTGLYKLTELHTNTWQGYTFGTDRFASVVSVFRLFAFITGMFWR